MKEAARVVALEADTLWVEADTASACQGCQARKACGHRLLDAIQGPRRIPLRLAPDVGAAWQVGDQLKLEMSGQRLIQLSLLLYCLPLACLLGASLLASLLGAREALVITAGLLGLGGGLLAVRHLTRGLAGECLPQLSPAPSQDREDLTR